MEILQTAAASLPVPKQYFKASLDAHLGQRNNLLHRLVFPVQYPLGSSGALCTTLLSNTKSMSED